MEASREKKNYFLDEYVLVDLKTFYPTDDPAEDALPPHQMEWTVKQEAHLIAMPDMINNKSNKPPGDASPDSMVINTLAIMERTQTQISKKIKCLMDREIVLSNKVLKEILHSTSDLVLKRQKLPLTVLNIWKAAQIPNLPQVFSDPYTTCISPEFRSLLEREKLPIGQVRNAEASKRLDSPRSPAFDKTLRQATFAPETPVQISTTKGPDMSNRDMDMLESPIVGEFPEQTSGRSPTKYSVPVELFEGTFSERAMSDRSFEHADKETSSISYQEFDAGLMNEEVNYQESDSGKLNGWSTRTRMVAKHLLNIFIDKKGKGAEEDLNLMQVLRSRTKSECARFFYEILVLKSKDIVGVKQERSDEDIIVTETPALEETLVSSYLILGISGSEAVALYL